MPSTDIIEDWKKRTGVLATMHNKESVIFPILKEGLGITVKVPHDFNTDRFGTFTRDIKRMGNQLEAARKKVQAAMKLTGMDLGFSSEGSFGNHPSIPFVQSNLEIVVLIDTKNDLEIVGHFRTSNTQVRSQIVHTPEEAVEVAHSWGFPKQGVILRQSETSSRHIYKEITTENDLRTMSEKLLSKWYIKSIFVETDMRAHRCPKRMDGIRQATLDLIKNCKSICPKCSTPGFVITDVVKGLPCKGCGLATDLVKETVRCCKKCSYQETQPIENKNSAEPGECQWCNP